MEIRRHQRDVEPRTDSRIDHERVQVLREPQVADEDRVLAVRHVIDAEGTEGVGACAVIAWSEQNEGISQGLGRVAIRDFAGNRRARQRFAG